MLARLQQNFLHSLKRQQKSHNTLRNYQNDLACFSQYFDKHSSSKNLNEFTTTMVLEYGHFLDKKYPNSSNSRRRRLQTLRLFFDYLVEKKIFSENPVKKAPVSPKELNVPSPPNMQDILFVKNLLSSQYQQQQSQLTKLLTLRNMTLFSLIYGAGLKVSELHDLQINNILDHDNNPRVTIRHSKRDPRTIPIPTNYSGLLEEYLTKRRRLLTEANIQSKKLFFNANGHKVLHAGLSPRGIELIFFQLNKSAKTSITPRSLRQACICKWLGQQKPSSSIKEWLGLAPSYSLTPYLVFMKNSHHNIAFSELSF